MPLDDLLTTDTLPSSIASAVKRRPSSTEELFGFGIAPRDMLRRVGWNSLGTILARGKGVLLLPLSLIVLGRSGYGLTTVAFATAAFLAPIFVLNIPDGAAVLVVGASTHLVAERRIWIIRRLCVRCALATVALAIPVAVLAHSRLVWWTAALTAAIILFKGSTIHLQYFQQAARLMRIQTLAEYMSAFGLLLALWGGPFAMIATSAAVLAIASAFAWRTLALTSTASTASDGTERHFWRAAMRLSLPLLPAAMSQWALLSVDSLLIYHQLGASSAGVYSAAYSLSSVALIVPLALNAVWFPTAQRVLALPWRDARRFIRRLTMWVIVASALAVAVTAVLAPIVGTIVLHQTLAKAARCVPWIVLGFSFLAIARVGEGILYARKHSILILASYLVAALVNLGLNLYWIPRLGILGAAYATAVGYGLLCVLESFAAIHQLRRSSRNVARARP
jgi:O-antigen/teichoic acid export membrane protein